MIQPEIGPGKPKAGFPQLRPIPHQNQVRRGLQNAALMLVLLVGGGSKLRAARLEGTVTDPSGRPVESARVSLLSPLRAEEERQADSQGKFLFESLPAGTYQLTASAPGFSAPPADVALRKDETKRIDLPLHLSALEQHVVVSATLGGALAPQVGSSVSILTRRDIEDRDAENLFEALHGIPGVEINQAGRRGGVTGVFVRGGNSNYNLVMVDGIEVNAFGGDFDFASLPADGVERVEVTRGPESALYGSNAVTSAINVVTRRGEGRAHFSALAEGGSFNTHRFSTGGSGLERGLDWAFNISKLVSQGVLTNDRYRNQSAFLSLGYSRPMRRQFNFHFFGNANDAGAPGPYGSDPDHLFPGIDTVSRDKQNLFGYGWQYSEEFSPRFRQVVTGTLATNDYYFISPFGDSFSNNKRATVNEQSQVTLSANDFLVAGLEWDHEQIKNTFIADANNTPFLLPRTSFAYFAENRWSPTARLFLITGLRVDDLKTHSIPPNGLPLNTPGARPFLPASSIVKVNPRLSLAYLAREGTSGNGPGATRFHGSLGTGIRAPNGFELAFNNNNPNLKPEKNVSFDSGVEQRLFSDRAVLDATYFYNRFEDQIVVLGASLTNLSKFSSANLGNARTQGLEVSLQAQPSRSLHFVGEYTLLATSLLAVNGANAALAPFRVGQPLLRRPRNSVFLGVTYSRRRLTLNSTAYLRGQILDVEPNLGTFACVPPPLGPGLACLFQNKGYQLVGAEFSYRLLGGVEMYGRVNNLLNQKYEESLGFPALHLNFLAGMRFNFPVE